VLLSIYNKNKDKNMDMQFRYIILNDADHEAREHCKQFESLNQARDYFNHYKLGMTHIIYDLNTAVGVTYPEYN
jgi:hypothetical protein